MNIGYWNINKKNNLTITPYIISLLKDCKLDLLFLSEYENLNVYQLNNDIEKYGYNCIVGNVCEKVIMLKRQASDFYLPTEDERFIVAQSLKNKTTIVGLHLESQMIQNSDFNRMKTMSRIYDTIKSLREKYDNVVLVGDFNCLPTDRELLDKEKIQCIPYKEEVRNSKNNDIFYNPILLFLNETNKQYGSLRYVCNEYTLMWYPFDQVMVSKNLIDSINNIKYLKYVGNKSFVSKNDIPNISDHLPLIFSIN